MDSAYDSTVLITGCGGGVGQSLIKCFQGTRYRVVGVDGAVLAAGLYAVPKAYRIPYADQPDYVARLLAICGIERPALLFPGLDAELPVLARAADQFNQAGVRPVISTPAVVAICDDKWSTAQFLAEHGFPAPETRPLTHDIAEVMALPLVLKPRHGGARSRGVVTVSSRAELDRVLPTIDEAHYVAQECVDGDEYTCSALMLEGTCHGVIVMRRLLRDGDTYKAFVVRDTTIEAHVRAVAEALQPFGPCNFQLRLRDGIPLIFEINARCSGTTYARALAGFNEPRMTADYLLRQEPPSYAIREIAVLRYWNELVVGNEEMAAIAERGTHEAGGRRL